MAIPPRSRGQAVERASRSFVARRVVLPAQSYIHTAGLSGFLLVAAAATATIWANSPWGDSYFEFQHTKLTLDLGFLKIEESLQHWVNDALMTLFFFVVGLEIKRELVKGELSDVRSASLPMVAALGGMVAPALIYVAANLGGNLRGWGIPMATDIAFALGVLALLGDRIPSPVRIFLLGLAIVDDIGAILVIALFYSKGISFASLGVAFGLLAVIVAMRYSGVHTFTPYILVGALIWLAVFMSGVHATLAGVVLGMLTPTGPFFSLETYERSARGLHDQFESALKAGDTVRAEMLLGQFEELTIGTEPPLDRLERKLHTWASYGVLPIFAFVNAGVRLDADSIRHAMSSPITLGIALGLVVGKIIGIVGFSWVAIRLGFAQLAKETTFKHLVGVAMLAGIGFTVSLFITELAFEESLDLAAAKIGILLASIVAAVLGFSYLRILVAPVRPNGESHDVPIPTEPSVRMPGMS